ncbi:MAG: hypothetical protein ACI9XO_003855 [Paraglaciecola sp.]|jgi:hypothetical protein
MKDKDKDKDKDILDNELREIAPFLSKMKNKGTGFDVPKDYFKKLPDEIFAQLAIDNQGVASKAAHKTSWLSNIFEKLNWLLQPRPTMAFASVLTLILAGLFLLNQPDNPSESIALSDISLEELETYLDTHIDEFDAEILVQGDENLLQNGIEKEDDMDAYFEEIIEETDLEDLL